MADDPYASFSQIEQTQEATQTQTQQTPSQDDSWNAEFWGFLRPTRGNRHRIDLYKYQSEYTIGRSSDSNIIFPDPRISNKHCIIKWDKRMARDSMVVVHDTSTNGTYINGYKIGKGKTAILRDGNEISFGTWSSTVPQPDEHRYMFRLTAAGRPQTGLHAFYDIGNELGRGSFATVMSAVHRETGKKYAVKIIHLNRYRYSSDPEALEKFNREIEILSSLNHPNICQLIEYFRDEATISLVLEYIAGGDLLDYIVSRDGVPEERARLFTFQLCEALKYLHDKRIAHRDLKPENILLTDDEPPVVKIADFGLAKAVDSMTKFMTTCGTPVYLAPEVILRDKLHDSYSTLVDSWSLGAIIFSMLTNATPFNEDKSMSNMEDRFRVRYVDWRLLNSKGVSSVCYQFVKLLLRENPSMRMSCAEALRHPWLLPLTLEKEAGPPSKTSLAEAQSPREKSFFSISSHEAAAGSFDSDASFDSSIPTPRANQHPVAAGVSAKFGQINMDDNDLENIVEEMNALQADSEIVGSQKLERRHMEVAEVDPEGHLKEFQDLDAALDSPDSPAVSEPPGLDIPPETSGKVAPPSAASRKRKERDQSLSQEKANAVDADAGSTSDSSLLTPISDVTDGAVVSKGPVFQKPNSRKKAVPKVVADERGPAKRTRAAVRQRGEDAQE